MYVTYLTIYDGDKMPPFYIGSTTAKRIDTGYRGSVRSKRFRDLWESELKFNPSLFETVVLSEHNTREEALLAEEALQRKHQVVTSDRFINQGLARGGFVNQGFTKEQRSKMSFSAKARWARGGGPKEKKATVDKSRSQNTKEKMSLAHKRQWADPVFREKMLVRNAKIKAYHQMKRSARTGEPS